MATVGLDCDIVMQHAAVNGGEAAGFLLKTMGGRKEFSCACPRVRSHSYTVDGGLAYTDNGPGRREWRMTVLAAEGMVDHRQAAVSAGPETIRTLLWSFYQLTNASLTFTDPAGESWSVRFDYWNEWMPDLPSREWEIEIVLLEV